MIRLFFIGLFAVVLPLSTAQAKPPYTVSVTPFAQLQLGQKEQEFRQFLDQNLSFYMLRFGLGLVADQLAVSLAGDWSIRDAQVSEEEETGRASREEYDVTVGYAITPAWTTFAGYKFGETTIRLSTRDAMAEPASLLRNRFEEAGPYLGASFQHRFDEAGAISVSLAYAWLDAANVLGGTVDENNEGDAPEFDDFVGRVNADSVGYGLGLRWSKRLTDWLSYQAGMKWQRYEQTVNQPGIRLTARETFTELSMGLSYRF